MRGRLSGWPHAAAAAAILLLDRLTKAWALKSLLPVGEIPLLPFLSLTYVENTGIAFGMFRGGNSFLAVLTAGLIGALFWWRRTLPAAERGARWALTAVLAGAVGNLYDRLAYGFVVDFVDFKVWPVFNVADSCITLGALVLAWTLREPAR